MITLILDIDGVLVTTPPWKPDQMHADGYSEFNPDCVDNLNRLLAQNAFEIWLSSTRRTHKTLQEFNTIFENRGISHRISGFLPLTEDASNRREEVQAFIQKNRLTDFFVIDDDKSLHAFNQPDRLVLTRLTSGFDNAKLRETEQKLAASTKPFDPPELP